MNPRPHNRGHALVGTMGFLVLMMLLWLAAFTQLSSYLRVQKASQVGQARVTGPMQAMATGLALLETGLPNKSPYSCQFLPASGQTCVITFTVVSSSSVNLTARFATSADTTLPKTPTSFAKGSSTH